MTTIKGYQMECKKDLVEIKRDTHNVLDWGFFEFQ